MSEQGAQDAVQLRDNPRSPWADTVRAWWRELQPDPARGQSGDRGALARLRRVDTFAGALIEPAVVDLARRLGCGATHSSLPRLATLVAVLAGVREDLTRGSLGSTLGGDDPCMSQLRLRAMLNARGEAELLNAFRRAVALAGGAVPVRDLARTLLGWDETGPGSPRTRLAFDYFGASAAAPRGVAVPVTPDSTEPSEPSA